MRTDFIIEVASLNRDISRARRSVEQLESELVSVGDRGQRSAVSTTLDRAKKYLKSLEQRKLQLLTAAPEEAKKLKGNVGAEIDDNAALSIMKGIG